MLRRTVVESPIGEMAMYARKCPGDREVLQEVVMRDCYGIERLDNANFSPDVVVDIGANIGAFSALALKYWPKTHIVAFEPHPLSFGLYRQNTRQSVGQIDAYLTAITGRELPNGFLQISAEAATDAPQCWDLNQRSEKVRPDPETQGYCECDVWNVNDALEGVPIKGGKNLLKIDCEGSEFYIIEGIEEELLKQFDVILMEVHCSQLAIEGYLDTTWSAFRSKILKHFDAPEIEKRTEVDRDQFIAVCTKKRA